MLKNSIFMWKKKKNNTESKTKDKIEVQGTVIDVLPGPVFKVELGEDFSNLVVRAYIGWGMRKNKISLIKWDTVSIELTPYDTSIGRITYRN